MHHHPAQQQCCRSHTVLNVHVQSEYDEEEMAHVRQRQMSDMKSSKRELKEALGKLRNGNALQEEALVFSRDSEGGM